MSILSYSCRQTTSFVALLVLLCLMFLVYKNSISIANLYMKRVLVSGASNRQAGGTSSYTKVTLAPNVQQSTSQPDTNGTFSARCPGANYACKDDKSKHLSKVLIIGVTKSGTTALEWFLLLHDQIKSGVGEPHFFDWYYERGVKWYCTQMPCTHDDVVVLERTPRYYVHLSQNNVYDFDPNMKLLLIVREPVDRMVSHLVHTYGYRPWPLYKDVVINRNNGIVNESAKHIFQSQYFK